MKKLLLATAWLVVGTYTLLANGGAWQTGVPGTGSASASNKGQKTDVTIENETLRIDLRPEYADVEVRYRMHNTGPKVQQDFFFPVERWEKNPDADTDEKRSDIDNYQAPSFFTLSNGRKLSLLAISAFGTNPEISTASDRIDLGTAIRNARSHADVVVCIVHWGIENSEKITDQQRELARWLIDRGVDVVVGSHPHCVQPLDFYHGCPVAYSLGNLVFDGASTVASWNHGALLEVSFNERANLSSASLIPLVLHDGLPQVAVTESNRFGIR